MTADNDAVRLAAVVALERRWTDGPGPNPRWVNELREALATCDNDAVLARVRALADQWNDTPDYAPTDYDQGRVDQRHDMTGQLLEALDTRPIPPGQDQS